MNGESSDSANAAGSSDSFQQERFERQFSTSSLSTMDEADEEYIDNYVPGPQLSLKEQLERDKEDESLRRWKEQLLGSFDYDSVLDKVDPEVTFVSMGVCCDDREINFPLFPEKRSNKIFFALKEGSDCYLKFTFTVKHNIVCGLKYSNTILRAGIQVGQNCHMLGTFSPRQEAYIQALETEKIPAGILARGTFLCKSKFIDDDGRCHVEFDYSFEIVKH